jgi:ribonucleotide reductase class II
MTELSVIMGEKTPTGNPVFYRSYSQRTPNGRENYGQVCERTIRGLQELGKLSNEEVELITRMQIQLKTLPSGRWLWIGGTDWIKNPKNYSGAYNCTSTNINDLRSIALLMDLAMMGSGTGAVLEPEYINKLPPVQTKLEVQVIGEIGDIEPNHRQEHTTLIENGKVWTITVGDSREGWVEAYYQLINLSMNKFETPTLKVIVDVRNVRPAGEPLKGFGGIANPIKLVELFYRVGSILNKAIGRQLDSVELCLLIGEAASTIVAGNLRRSAGMRQAPFSDLVFAASKTNLWEEYEPGNWRIDPERDALRMANHSRVCHQKPTRDECIDAVRQQYYSGEGAIQWAGEAVARASCDLIPDKETKQDFLKAYNQGRAKQWISDRHPSMPQLELDHRLQRYGLNPCGK